MRAHWLALGWTFFILAACSIPGRDLPRVGVPDFDKLAHVGVFLVFGMLWMRALHLPVARRTGAVVAGGLAYAVFTEIYQGWLPFERTPDPFDALANALGLLLGVGVYYVLYRRRQRVA